MACHPGRRDRTQRSAGVVSVGSTVIVTGSWASGSLTMGPSTKRAVLANPSTTNRGFVGFLRDDGTWLEEVSITINSLFGQPTPHQGADTVAAGKTITSAVPSVVFEDAVGTILDPSDADTISNRAVTRRICTGYQFDDSDVNGTVNTVTFIATGDTELTFLWRTEHAVEIDSEIIDTGLSSTAAGNPSPTVQKHWIRENEQFTAFIDGAESDPTKPGVRWRSTGFIAAGCVAAAQGIESGSFYTWSGYQPRQQTAKITVGSPGRITWRWRKETSLRVAVNSSVATSAPYVERPYRFADGVQGFPQSGITLSFHEARYMNDGLGSKYLNFAKVNTGVVLSYAGGLVANRCLMKAADDISGRDPRRVKVEARQRGGAWVELAPNVTIPNLNRQQVHEFTFSNSAAYDDYRFTVLEIAMSTRCRSKKSRLEEPNDGPGRVNTGLQSERNSSSDQVVRSRAVSAH